MTEIKIAERKVQMKTNQHGDEQYSIHLPIKWIEKLNIVKGDKLECIINSKKPNELIIRESGEW